MKEILFRGKRITDDEWIEGFYVNVEDFESGEECPVIIPIYADIYSYGEIDTFDFVDPTTVGQFTGKVDRNGSYVYEGDILHKEVRGRKFIMVINDIRRDLVGLCVNSYEIIGNVHDNPELLEVKV